MEIDKHIKLDEPSTDVSSMIFRLDPRSGVPTYLQLVQQVEHALRLGYLVLGDQFPRVKDVVATLSINPNTVLKAYRDLEQKGLIGARPGLGTFIVAAPETLGIEELDRLRRNLISGFLRDASTAGLDEDGIVALFMAALRDFYDRSGERPMCRAVPTRQQGRALHECDRNLATRNALSARVGTARLHPGDTGGSCRRTCRTQWRG